jgi:hypothetical protein
MSLINPPMKPIDPNLHADRTVGWIRRPSSTRLVKAEEQEAQQQHELREAGGGSGA